jgi:hypothetical protein
VEGTSPIKYISRIEPIWSKVVETIARQVARQVAIIVKIVARRSAKIASNGEVLDFSPLVSRALLQAL